MALTFKPAVQSAWDEDLQTQIDFKDWQFISHDGLSYQNADKAKPFVCFGSFQDYLGKNEAGGIKSRNEWVHATHGTVLYWMNIIMELGESLQKNYLKLKIKKN